MSDKTILFSDRPDKIVKSVSTTGLDNLSMDDDSSVTDAPNAVIIVDEKEVQNVVIIELFTPVYDSDKKVLKYDVIPDNDTSINLPNELGKFTLMIDESPAFRGDIPSGLIQITEK